MQPIQVEIYVPLEKNRFAINTIYFLIYCQVLNIIFWLIVYECTNLNRLHSTQMLYFTVKTENSAHFLEKKNEK